MKLWRILFKEETGLPWEPFSIVQQETVEAKLKSTALRYALERLSYRLLLRVSCINIWEVKRGRKHVR